MPLLFCTNIRESDYPKVFGGGPESPPRRRVYLPCDRTGMVGVMPGSESREGGGWASR